MTMKPGGTGLGLPIVKKIVEEHGGSLLLTDAPGQQGGHIEIRLPRERQAAPSVRRQKSDKEQKRRNE